MHAEVDLPETQSPFSTQNLANCSTKLLNRSNFLSGVCMTSLSLHSSVLPLTCQPQSDRCGGSYSKIFSLVETTSFRERKISPKFSCIKFLQIRDIPTQIPGYPGHPLSKTTEKGHLHKVFVRDIPTSGSLMSQEYPAQTFYV